MVDIQQNRLKLNLNGEMKLNQKRGIENKQKPDNVAFTGHQLKINDKGNKEFHFYLPVASDKKENAKLVVKLAEELANGQYKIIKDVDSKELTKDGGLKSWAVDVKETFGKEEKSANNNKLRLLYKFEVDNNEVLDKTLSTNVDGQDFNVATLHTRAVIETPHSMYHLMPDNFNPKFATYTKANAEKVNAGSGLYIRNSNGTFLKVADENVANLKGKDTQFYVRNESNPKIDNKENYIDYAVRQHYFNKFGGTLKGISEKLDYLKDFGVSRILSTPVFGQDQISNHGYWTTNPYQITQTVGTHNSFMDINKQLYTKGMAWVADGAFVNEGWEGIHINNITKWGDKSPFFHWFETFDFPMHPLKAGLLPENDEAYKNCAIKVINSPIDIKLNSKGEYEDKKGEANKSYDPTKPTYIQLLDRRFATKEQMQSNEPIRKYDNMAPVNPATGEAIDPNEVKTWKDGVQPVLMEVPASEVKEKFTKEDGLVSILRSVLDLIPGDIGTLIFGKPKVTQPSLEKLKQWQDAHLEIQQADKSGGTTLWVGNKDIHKLRFMLPNDKTAELSKKVGLDTLNKSTAQVQDYILQVGKYWTDEVDKTITQYTADKIGEKLSNDADYKAAEAIQTPDKKAEAKAKATLKVIKSMADDKTLPAKLNTQLNEAMLVNFFKDEYNLKLPKAENITDGLMSYPLDAIEFPREICGILSTPFIKKLANDHDETSKSRYQISTNPELMKTRSPIYKKMDKVYSEDMKNRTLKILNQLPKETLDKLIDPKTKDIKDTDEAKMAFRIIAGDISKYITVKALTNHKLGFDEKNPDKGIDLTHDGSKFLSADIDAQKPVDNPYKGLHDDFYKYTKLITTTPESEADSLVDALKTGINNDSRFGDSQDFAKYLEAKLKNVMDKDVLPLAKLCVDRSESGLEWRIDAAKDVADMDSKIEGKSKLEDLAVGTAKFWKKFNETVRDINPRAYTIGEVTDYGGKEEKQLIEDTGFTTQSNYRYFYGTPALYAGGKHENEGPTIGNLKAKFDNPSDTGYPGFLHSGPQDNVNFSHVFQSNHDASRVLTKLVFNSIVDPDDKSDYKDKLTGDQEHDNIMKMRNQICRSFDDVIKTSKVLNHSEDFIALNDNEKKLLKDSIVKIANEYSGYDKDDIVVERGTEQEKINKVAMQNNFASRGIGHNFDDIMKKLKTENPDLYKKIEPKLYELKNEVSQNFLAPALSKYLTMLPLVVALPGSPTMYQGDELGELGLESQGKNMYLSNRNPIPWDKMNGDNKVNFIADFQRKVQDIYSLRQKPELSPLVNGSTIPMKYDGDNNDNQNKLGFSLNVLYRYNQERDVIAVLNRNGLGAKRSESEVKSYKVEGGLVLNDEKNDAFRGWGTSYEKKSNYVGLTNDTTYIPIIIDKDGNQISYNKKDIQDNITNKKIANLPEGITLTSSDAEIDRVINNMKFKTVKEGNTYKLVPANGNKDFSVDGSAMYFYRENTFQEEADKKEKNKISFTGKYGSLKPGMKNVNISG
ncbi:MAG: alpha-amylase family glycosyl hydrolase [bacterium]